MNRPDKETRIREGIERTEELVLRAYLNNTHDSVKFLRLLRSYADVIRSAERWRNE